MKIIRNIFTENQTLGILVTEGFDCKTLELPYLDNMRNISCIPAGCYPCEKRYSKKYGYHFIILNVPNRDYILIHTGNFNTQTKGCILVGNSYSDINSDGELDVLNSKKTLEKLYKSMPHFFDIEVIDISE